MLLLPVYIPPAPTTTAAPTSSASPTVPTPYVTTFPSTGVYTIPASTITITSETTVCAATSTPIASSGVYTVGGVTTVVQTSTVVVVPYATTTSTPGGEMTSTILTTSYTCSESGTYTIAPLTTTVSTSTVWVYPITSSYPAGTYTQPAVTVTVTETAYPYVCPYETVPPPPPPASTSAPAPVQPTSQAAAPTTSSYPTGGESGSHWAMTYTPYDSNGDCKTYDAVISDVAEIAQKGFKALRVYSTDCSALQNIGTAAADNSLKLILGVYISGSGLSVAQEQVEQIAQWKKWTLVDLIVIGNEAVQDGYVSASQLAGFISASKAAFQAAGYSGQVTTAEPLDVWQSNSATLCGAVDVVGCNIHPFFNGDVIAAQAGSFITGQLKIVDSLCPGKTGVNLETGWPSKGNCNNLACPGPVLQEIAIKAITEAVGDRSVILSFANDLWKVAGPFDVEQYWGAINLFS